MGMQVILHKNVGMYRSLKTYLNALKINTNSNLIKNTPVYFNMFNTQLILAKKLVNFFFKIKQRNN